MSLQDQRIHLLRSLVAMIAMVAVAPAAIAQHDQGRTQVIQGGAPSNSAMAQSLANSAPVGPKDNDYHALRQASMFAVPPPRPRELAVHDLVQIIVRETTNVKSTQSLDSEKEYGIDGKIKQWPAFSLPELLQLQLQQSTGTPLALDLEFNKEFEGEGEYRRRDDFSARLTAEVIEILPNGNLVLEARTSIQTDEETSTMKVTGICRSQDITSLNTVLSNQLHDLTVKKMNDGELRKASEKGIIARVLDTLFAF